MVQPLGKTGWQVIRKLDTSYHMAQQSTRGFTPERNEKLHARKILHMNVHSIIHDSQDVETT